MAHYGVMIKVDEGKGYETPYSFVVDTTAQVRELLLKTTAPITEVIVMEEYSNGKEAVMLTAEEILRITLNHPREALSLA